MNVMSVTPGRRDRAIFIWAGNLTRRRINTFARKVSGNIPEGRIPRESIYQYGVDYIAPISYPAREGTAEILEQISHSKAEDS